jgi:hypothetical protein
MTSRQTPQAGVELEASFAIFLNHISMVSADIHGLAFPFVDNPISERD